MLSFARCGALAGGLRHVIYSPRGYVVPRRDGRLLAGSTTEHAGFERAVTPHGIATITTHASEMIPALEGVSPAQSWAGLRPRADDERPVIGSSHRVRNLFYATGFYRNGILLAPLTGEVVAGLIAHGGARTLSPRSLEAFSPERFGRAFAGSHGE
jgi:glycine oxidase